MLNFLIVLLLCQLAGEVIVVTTPEPTAMVDGYNFIRNLCHQKGCGRVRLVVNQARNPLEAARVSHRIRMVARRFLRVEVDSLGFVLTDPHVEDAVRRRRPFVLEYPKSPASQSVRAIAERICGEEPVVSSSGFFRRFAKAIQGVLS